jgi:hypothetical protein
MRRWLVILLVKAASRREAVRNAEGFLSHFGNGLMYSIYRIGGKFSGFLTGHEPAKDPANVGTCRGCGGTGRSTGTQPEACAQCHGTGQSVKPPEEWVPHDGDVMPLGQVKARVASYLGRWHESELDRANEAICECDGIAYVIREMEELKCAIESDIFCDRSRAYDTVNHSNSVPDAIDGYWAVVVELHVPIVGDSSMQMMARGCSILRRRR